MNNNNLQKVIESSKVIVHKGKYAYLKAENANLADHFLITKDKDEITIITEEKNLAKIKYSNEVKWFTLIEIQVSMPFVAKGFLAKITKTIAEKDLNILVVSTFSKDYILVKEETSKIAIEALKEVGFPIVGE